MNDLFRMIFGDVDPTDLLRSGSPYLPRTDNQNKYWLAGLGGGGAPEHAPMDAERGLDFASMSPQDKALLLRLIMYMMNTVPRMATGNAAPLGRNVP